MLIYFYYFSFIGSGALRITHTHVQHKHIHTRSIHTSFYSCILVFSFKSEPVPSRITSNSSDSTSSSYSDQPVGLDKLLTDKIENENQRKQTLTTMKADLSEWKVRCYL